MTHKKLELNKFGFESIPVDVTYYHTNEKPEHLCVNQVTVLKYGHQIFQYFDTTVEEGLARLEYEINRNIMEVPPKIVLCVQTTYKSEFCIDWHYIQKHAEMEMEIHREKQFFEPRRIEATPVSLLLAPHGSIFGELMRD